MRRYIDPSGIEVKANRSSDGLAEDPLTLDGEFASQDLRIGLPCGAHDGGKERWKVAGQRLEHRPQAAGRGPGLVGIEEGVIGGFHETQALGLAALQTDDRFE